jgi:Fe2+ transport system protein B
MDMTILNTHAVVKKFIQHGFTEEHAELIVDAINDQSDQLATKNDLAMIKTEIKGDINKLQAELKADITEVKAELKADISLLKEEIKEVKVDLLKWFIPLVLTVLISNIAILIALFK